MFIEYLRITGYKSLKDVALTDLGPINVFHGHNDVGKSNVLEAIDLFLQLLPLALEIEVEWEGLASSDLWPYSPATIFRFQSTERRIEWQARLRPPGQTASLEVNLRLQRDGEEGEPDLDLALTWPAGRPDEQVERMLRQDEAGFNLLRAGRRFQIEYLEGEEEGKAAPRTRRPQITAYNLKRALFDAYASLDLDRRARFNELQGLLQRHFEVGTLDVGLSSPRHYSSDSSETTARQIVVRFLRPDCSVNVENVGSGVQQILLILGQSLLNPARVVGIEEPEMNLSPDWQACLMAVLRDLISPDPGGLDQIFVTSHSPYFEFRDCFYKVTYADQATQVERVPLKERETFFGPRQPLGEQRKQRLNSQNQITLYREVIEDLGLEPGDMVYFNKNPLDRWELLSEKEALAELQEAFDELDAG